jgi:hypothetical protein
LVVLVAMVLTPRGNSLWVAVSGAAARLVRYTRRQHSGHDEGSGGLRLVGIQMDQRRSVYTLHVIFGFKTAGPADLLPVLGLSWDSGLLSAVLDVNMAIIPGIESIKWMETLSAPFCYWSAWSAGMGRFWPVAVVLSMDLARVRGMIAASSTSGSVWPNLTAWWASEHALLKHSRLYRYARSQRDQAWVS